MTTVNSFYPNTTSIDVDVATPPDFVREYDIAGLETLFKEKIKAAIEEFRPLGVTHCRATTSVDGSKLWVEGWKVRPALETPPPTVESCP